MFFGWFEARFENRTYWFLRLRHLATISKNVLHRTKNSQQLIAEHAGYISVEVKIIVLLKLKGVLPITLNAWIHNMMSKIIFSMSQARKPQVLRPFPECWNILSKLMSQQYCLSKSIELTHLHFLLCWLSSSGIDIPVCQPDLDRCPHINRIVPTMLAFISSSHRYSCSTFSSPCSGWFPRFNYVYWPSLELLLMACQSASRMMWCDAKLRGWNCSAKWSNIIDSKHTLWFEYSSPLSIMWKVLVDSCQAAIPFGISAKNYGNNHFAEPSQSCCWGLLVLSKLKR